MIKSLTLAELLRAGATSKLHHYNQNVQKMKDLSKTCVLTGKHFEDFRQKKQKQKNRPFKKPSGTQEPWKRQLKMALVNSKNQLVRNLKTKEIRSKPFEINKTRTG